MTTSIMPSDAPPLENIKARSTDGLARKFLLGILGKLKRGKITIIDGPIRYVFGQSSSAYPLEAVINVYHPRFYSKAVLGGSIGTAEAYMNGLWSADDLTTALRVMAINRHSFERLDEGWSTVSAPLHKIRHFLRKNTRSGSRKNIVAHYDLGNDFYHLFLDDTLTYSCGIFESDDSSMQDASLAKYERICRKLELGPGDNVIEIGSGWGGFAIYAAQNYGCRVTTTTISDQQAELAQQRIAGSGVADRIDLVKKDYRDLKGTYSKLVSIEMIEAVGHHYLDDFFRSCSQLLKPDGMMLLQAITIADQVYERHKHSVDFIKRYIDLMSRYKMNTFHWHLTDDQGWRIEIERYPKLTEIGSRRAESPKPGARDEGDGTPYGGFYTQEEIREVVAYAAERFVTIVPEIEMPGHCKAALAAYPDLSCTRERGEVETQWGVFEDVFCAGSTGTLEFLENVLTEVVEARERDIVVICRSGKRSVLAADVMQKMGYSRVRSLKTGLRGWSDYEQEMVDADGQPVDEDTAIEYFTPRLRPEQLSRK